MTKRKSDSGKRILNKKLSPSSRRWVQRHLKDPFVHQAQKEGYRSRAAFKLEEINARFRLIHPSSVILDLGAAPGGWSQIAAQHLHPEKGLLVAVDLLEIDPLPGVVFIQGDMREEEVQTRIAEHLAPFSGRATLILSDMAPSTTGHRATDNIRMEALIDETLSCAERFLAPQGHLVIKTFQGGVSPALSQTLKQRFLKMTSMKPKASRKESSEMYLIAQTYQVPLKEKS